MLVFTSLKIYGIQLLKNIITHETLQSITALCCNLHQISNSLNSCFHNLLIGLGLSRQGFKPRTPARKANAQPLTHPCFIPHDTSIFFTIMCHQNAKQFDFLKNLVVKIFSLQLLSHGCRTARQIRLIIIKGSVEAPHIKYISCEMNLKNLFKKDTKQCIYKTKKRY